MCNLLFLFWRSWAVLTWGTHEEYKMQYLYLWVSLKQDGSDRTVKMANLPVPSVCDRRDRLSHLCVTRRDRLTTAKTWQDRQDSENGQSACPVIVWQMGQELNEKLETKLKTYKKCFIMKIYVFLGQ